jgi:periplasmic protein TonB
MRDHARQRIEWALGVSALLHVWFIHTAPQPGAPRATATGVPIAATLSQPQRDRLAPPPAPHVVPHVERLAADSALATEPARSVAGARAAGAVVPTLPRLPVSPMPQPSASSRDATATATATATSTYSTYSTYYSARDLDVFPKAITALDLGLRAGTAGKVRATVLIDEPGTVNDVRAIDAGVAEIEHAVRDLLLRARFTPASKDGRLVKAQLMVSLDYGALPP